MSVLEISRVDRVDRTYDLAALFPDLEGPLTTADVALLTQGGRPTAATVWTPVTVTNGVATVLWAGPDADSTGAVAVAGTCDSWMRVSDGDETRAVKLGRITVLGGGAQLAAPVGVPVVSVNGKTGSAVVLTSGDVGAVAVGAGAGGALSGSYPNPGLNTTALDNAVEGLVNDTASDASVALRAAFGRVFTPEQFGTCPGDNTDVTAFVQAAIDAAQAAGGGTVLLDSKRYTCLGALAPGYTLNGAGKPVQKPLRITSASGGTTNGYWDPSPINGGPILDLRYAGSGGAHPAKFDTRGAGFLEIDHITFASGGTDDFPFFQTTNTKVDIHHCGFIGNTAKAGTACVQDAIVFGGTQQTNGPGANEAFQGYGSVVHDNYFSHIRRCFYGRAYCNSTGFYDNTVSTSCGSSTGGAYVLDGGGNPQRAVGNWTRGNTMEINYYKYGIEARNAQISTFGPDGFWDATAAHVGAVYVDATSADTRVVEGYSHIDWPLVIDPGNTTTVDGVQLNQPQRLSNLLIGYRGVASVQDGVGAQAVAADGNRSFLLTGRGAPYPTTSVCTFVAKQTADGVTTSGSTTVTSATAGWNVRHVGLPIFGPGIPTGALILDVVGTTQVTISKTATATATGVALSFYDTDVTVPTTEISFNRRHIVSAGAIGATVALAGAGTRATFTAAGTDTAFTVTLTTGTATSAADLGRAVFGINFGAVPKAQLTPKNAAAAAAATAVYVTNTGSNLTLAAASALPASTQFIWDVMTVQ